MIQNPDLENDTKLSSSVLTVEQLNRQIRQMLEGQFQLLWVQGEISNFKAHTSGHFYFSLKDSKSQISAVMFRGHNARLKFKPTDGLQVVVRCRVTVYEPRGNYQLAVEQMEPLGAGALQKAFEQLKAKLKSEGLFEASRKRALPAFPRHIAIVTSPTGAAIRDMLQVLSRRNRGIPVTLIPTLVQGEGAAPQIREALGMAWRLPNVDLIILGRGGGSIEDLWAFNDEELARLIAQSPVPVISAVGHEIDFTIADFVADVRAPTPSAAAELAVKDTAHLIQSIQILRSRIDNSIEKIFKSFRQAVWHAQARLIDPKRRLQDLEIRRDELTERLYQAILHSLDKRKLNVQVVAGKLLSPQVVLDRLVLLNQKLELRLVSATRRLVENLKYKFLKQVGLLETLSPLKTLERGYAIVSHADKVVSAVKDLNENEEIEIRFVDGRAIGRIESLIKE